MTLGAGTGLAAGSDMVLHYSDYYADYRWCPSCRTYVHYLSALEESYCIQCGKKIRCFRNAHALEEVPHDDRDGERRKGRPQGHPDPGLPHSA